APSLLRRYGSPANLRTGLFYMLAARGRRRSRRLVLLPIDSLRYRRLTLGMAQLQMLLYLLQIGFVESLLLPLSLAGKCIERLGRVKFAVAEVKVGQHEVRVGHLGGFSAECPHLKLQKVLEVGNVVRLHTKPLLLGGRNGGDK